MDRTAEGPRNTGTRTASLAVLPAWAKRKGWNDRLALAVARDARSFDYGRKLRRCAQRVTVELDLSVPGVAEQRVTSAHLCQQRLCPVCSWRKATAWRRRLIPGLQQFHELYPTYRPLFLTLTVRNCRPEQLRDTINDMHAGWGRLCKRAEFPTQFWLRRTEVTISGGYRPAGRNGSQTPTEIGPADPHRKGGQESQDSLCENEAGGILPLTVHPHIHALLLVKSRYFAADYIRQKRWQELWWESARLDYCPVVDIRRGRAKEQTAGTSRDTLAAAMEAAKYISKSDDFAKHPELFSVVTNELRGLRLIGVSKELSRWVRPEEPDADEMLDPEADGVPQGFAVKCIAQWDSAASEFFLKP